MEKDYLKVLEESTKMHCEDIRIKSEIMAELEEKKTKLSQSLPKLSLKQQKL